MAREKKLYEWAGDFRTFEEIKAMEKKSDATIYKYLADGLTSAPKRRIVAARPKLELPKPQKVNVNCIVRVRHPELDSALNYLARTTGKTYQSAFEEFIIYIFEGHLWGQDSFTILKSRLAKHQNAEIQSQKGADYAMPEEKQMSGWQQRLIPYVEELEAKVSDLQARNTKLENIVRQLRIFMQKAEDES